MEGDIFVIHLFHLRAFVLILIVVDNLLLRAITVDLTDKTSASSYSLYFFWFIISMFNFLAFWALTLENNLFLFSSNLISVWDLTITLGCLSLGFAVYIIYDDFGLYFFDAIPPTLLWVSLCLLAMLGLTDYLRSLT